MKQFPGDRARQPKVIRPSSLWYSIFHCNVWPWDCSSGSTSTVACMRDKTAVRATANVYAYNGNTGRASRAHLRNTMPAPRVRQGGMKLDLQKIDSQCQIQVKRETHGIGQRQYHPSMRHGGTHTHQHRPPDHLPVPLSDNRIGTNHYADNDCNKILLRKLTCGM